MAQICPQLDDVTLQHGGLQRERDVIERLQLGLPDAYCVVHSAGWHSVHDGHDHYGEIDVVVIAPNDNYRTPRAICEVINALRLTPEPVNARSPWTGQMPGFRVFQNVSASQVSRLTEAAVEALCVRGIALSDIVVLSWHGFKKSLVLGSQRLGRYDLKCFAGSFDRRGSPV